MNIFLTKSVRIYNQRRELTTKGKYAVTAVLDLAIQEQADATYSKISEVAQRQSIPAPYLEQISVAPERLKF